MKNEETLETGERKDESAQRNSEQQPKDTERLVKLPLGALLYSVMYGDDRLARLK